MNKQENIVPGTTQDSGQLSIGEQFRFNPGRLSEEQLDALNQRLGEIELGESLS